MYISIFLNKFKIVIVLSNDVYLIYLMFYIINYIIFIFVINYNTIYNYNS